MFTTIAVLSLALASTPAARVTNVTMYRPRVELWTNRGDGAVYTRGERVRLFFRLDQDAYVTIFRVDTDGRVRVLFPHDPWEDNFARGGRDFEVDGRDLDSDAFMIDDYPGVGYLFAVASADAFTYDQIETGDHWDYRAIADGRVRGDPYVAMTDLAQRIVPEGSSDWDYDVVSYNVGQHYDYPRFLCYDCHSYVSYSYWDPYYTSCIRFRMVVYDDPYYYPYRYYGGGRVVFVRPFRPQPRFIFKDWGSDRPSREGFVSREHERPANDNGRRGVTSQDIGGLGVIPPPNVRERGRPGNDGNGNNGNDQRNNGNDNRGNGRRQQPDHPDHPDQPVRPDRPGRPDRPDNPNNPDRPDRRQRPDRPDRPEGGRTPDRPTIMPTREQPGLRDVGADSRRVEPRAVQPRAEPRQVEPRRVEPRNEPRGEPPRAEPGNEPRSQPQPRAEPRNNPPPQRGDSKPRNEPEVRRRKP